MKQYQVRCISGASDRFNAFFGPPILGFSKALSQSWNSQHWMLYTSGVGSVEFSDWCLNQCSRLGVDFENCVKVLSDESRQDAHVSHLALEWEADFLLWCGVPSNVVEELKECHSVKGFSRWSLMYSRKGGRNTGDPHTSSSNSAMNGLKACYTLCKLIPNVDLSNPPFAISIQGDDSFILLADGVDQYLTKENIVSISAELGFKVKFVTITRDIVKLDYCSRYFWPTDGHELGYILGPKIGKVLNKIGFSRIFEPDLLTRNRGIALGMLCDVNHIPFLKQWCEHLLSLSIGGEDIEEAVRYGLHSDRTYEYNSKTWDHLFQRYGLTQNDLSTFEHSLEQADSLPYYVGFPVDLSLLVAIDNL